MVNTSFLVFLLIVFCIFIAHTIVDVIVLCPRNSFIYIKKAYQSNPNIKLELINIELVPLNVKYVTCFDD